MSVYVDTAVPQVHRDFRKKYLKGQKWCHLVADTEEELHKFAELLGLKRAWCHRNSKILHYDLVESKRELAVRNGAVELSRKEFVKLWPKLPKGLKA